MVLNIRTKITLIALAILCLTLAATTVTNSYISMREYTKLLQSESIVIAQSLKFQLDRVLKLKIPIEDLVGFEEQCNELVHKYELLSYAMVVDLNGNVLFKSNTNAPVAEEPVSKTVNVVSEKKEKVHEVIMGTQKYYDTVVPVFDTSGKHIAAVRVGFPAVLVSEKATGMVTYSIVLAAISFLLAIPLLIASLSKWVTKPLGNLLTVIEDVRAKGAGFEEEVEIVSRDEIGRLSIAFNEMMENLRNSHMEIQRQNEILEERIEERTAELRMDREALRRSEEKYRTILQSIEEGYLELDQEGNVIFTNESACKILGYTRTELNASNYREFTDEENFSAITNILSTVFDTGIPNKGFESVMKRKDGSSVPIDGTVLLMRDSKQQTTGCRMTFRDITERRQADTLRQAKIAAEAANQSKSEFLANMSHEIRTPLNGIIGMSELAMDTDLDRAQQNIFHTINSEANALLGIINDILDFSKIEAKKFELEKISFNLSYLIEDLLSSSRHRAEKKGLELSISLSRDVPHHLIGDPGRLRQILINLVGNAIKFTHEGSVSIEVESVEDLGDKIKLKFSIIDTGIGIPEEKQPTIFEEFTQADSSTSRKYGGTGLGTAISQQLTKLMDGEIGFESEEGKGSTFWFTGVFKKQPKQTLSIPNESIGLSGLKVLVVDDNDLNRHILEQHLESWGCKPVCAPDGETALSRLKDSAASEKKFDIILSDVQMPEINGFQLAEKIRAIEPLRSIPIIILTSAGQVGDSRLCKEIGIEGYMTKPVRQKELSMAMTSVLDLARQKEVPEHEKLVTRHTIAEKDRKPIQILLAEDYPTNQMVAMRHLKKAGFEVDLAEDGKQAVDAFQKKPYDLILMDIQMPEMDGYEATIAIRDLEKTRRDTQGKGNGSGQHRIPIIAMTAHAVKGYKERSLAVGMNDYITKPLKRRDLLTMIEKWVSSEPDTIDIT